MTPSKSPELTDALLERMLGERAGSAAPADLVSGISAAVATASQLDRGLLRWPRGPWGRLLVLVAIGLLLLAVLAAIVVGASLLRPPAVVFVPAPTSPAPETDARPTPSALTPSPAATTSALSTAPPANLIAYVSPDPQGAPPTLVWVIRNDGTGARALAAALGGCQHDPSWAPDGRRLVFSRSEPVIHDRVYPGCQAGPPNSTGGDRLYLADASAAAPLEVATDCIDPCDSDSDGAIAADDRHLVFVRHRHDRSGYGSAALATIDLATGRLTELDATDSGYPIWRPSWSPDARRIAFARGTEAGFAIFVVDADGTDLHEVSRSGETPRWSPDGSRIAFTRRKTSKVSNAPGPDQREYVDIYTVRPDGTDLQRLTSDDYSELPDWTSDGRIRFLRTRRDDGRPGGVGRAGWWIMDADGRNASRLDLPSEVIPVRGDYDPGIPSWPSAP